MTWYFDPYGQQLDVYDHEGTLVEEGYSYKGWWSGDYPSEVLDIMYNHMSGSQSNYNQQTLRCAALGRIRHGTP